MKVTATLVILEQLANEQRRILSGWRGLILLRRATFATPPHLRRWDHLPQDTDELSRLFGQMRKRGEITPIPHFRQLFEVTVPYARQGFVDEREILFEVNPYAVLSHFSALVFHGLTDEQPKGLTSTIAADVRGGLLPIGTGPNDWEGVAFPGGRRAARIAERPVEWVTVKPERFFGFAEYQPFGVPLRCTTLERTLIDGLQDPERCGGIASVFRAWVTARDSIELDALIYQVERYGVAILRQRVGYVLDQLDLTHPHLEQWRQESRRGGSSRMVGTVPFVSTYDERWNISLNAPVAVLHGEDG